MKMLRQTQDSFKMCLNTADLTSVKTTKKHNARPSERTERWWPVQHRISFVLKKC